MYRTKEVLHHGNVISAIETCFKITHLYCETMNNVRKFILAHRCRCAYCVETILKYGKKTENYRCTSRHSISAHKVSRVNNILSDLC
jgi:hypothetical protein